MLLFVYTLALTFAYCKIISIFPNNYYTTAIVEFLSIFIMCSLYNSYESKKIDNQKLIKLFFILGFFIAISGVVLRRLTSFHPFTIIGAVIIYNIILFVIVSVITE